MNGTIVYKTFFVRMTCFLYQTQRSGCACDRKSLIASSWRAHITTVIHFIVQRMKYTSSSSSLLQARLSWFELQRRWLKKLKSYEKERALGTPCARSNTVRSADCRKVI